MPRHSEVFPPEGARVATQEPRPTSMRLEVPREVTGNGAASNAGIIAMNGFTLVASATAPWFIFPRLGLDGPAAFVGLVLIPLIYSLLFFAFPAARALGAKQADARNQAAFDREMLRAAPRARSRPGRSPPIAGGPPGDRRHPRTCA